MEFPLDEERAKKAYEALLKYLTASPRSERECKEKLYSKGFHRDEVEYAIEKAKKYRYIDDAAYVAAYLSFNRGRYGVKKIAYKLATEKGISKELIDDLVVISDDEEREKCMKMALGYIRQKHIEDKSGAKKLSAYLYQKGFEWSTINFVVSKLFDVYEDA